MQRRKNLRQNSQEVVLGILCFGLCLMVLAAPNEALAQMPAAEGIARRLADPLAITRAILIDNDVLFFDSGNGEKKGELYSFKLTPVWAIDLKEKNFSLIPRVFLPLNGRFRSEVYNLGRIWGWGDMVFQIFVAPQKNSAWKWGIGPQFSLETRSQPQLGGIGNGMGLSGVIVGDLSSQISLALLISNCWSFDGKYSIASIQPFLTYHFRFAPGLYVNYQQTTTISWKAKGTKVSLPLGAGIGRTWALSDRGHGFDFNFSIYFFPLRPEGAPLWSLKFKIGFVLP